jgi:hypothetical protein
MLSQELDRKLKVAKTSPLPISAKEQRVGD